MNQYFYMQKLKNFPVAESEYVYALHRNTSYCRAPSLLNCLIVEVQTVLTANIGPGTGAFLRYPEFIFIHPFILSISSMFIASIVYSIFSYSYSGYIFSLFFFFSLQKFTLLSGKKRKCEFPSFPHTIIIIIIIISKIYKATIPGGPKR